MPSWLAYLLALVAFPVAVHVARFLVTFLTLPVAPLVLRARRRLRAMVVLGGATTACAGTLAALLLAHAFGAGRALLLVPALAIWVAVARTPGVRRLGSAPQRADEMSALAGELLGVVVGAALFVL